MAAAAARRLVDLERESGEQTMALGQLKEQVALLGEKYEKITATLEELKALVGDILRAVRR